MKQLDLTLHEEPKYPPAIADFMERWKVGVENRAELRAEAEKLGFSVEVQLDAQGQEAGLALLFPA